MSSDIKYVLAIDLGTSGPKVVLVSVFGDILDHEFGDKMGQVCL